MSTAHGDTSLDFSDPHFPTNFCEDFNTAMWFSERWPVQWSVDPTKRMIHVKVCLIKLVETSQCHGSSSNFLSDVLNSTKCSEDLWRSLLESFRHSWQRPLRFKRVENAVMLSTFVRTSCHHTWSHLVAFHKISVNIATWGKGFLSKRNTYPLHRVFVYRISLLGVVSACIISTLCMPQWV